jgi:hypothetical protein
MLKRQRGYTLGFAVTGKMVGDAKVNRQTITRARNSNDVASRASWQKIFEEIFGEP